MSYLSDLLRYADMVRALDSSDAREIACALRQLRSAGVRFCDVVSEIERTVHTDQEWQREVSRREYQRWLAQKGQHEKRDFLGPFR